MKKFIIAALGVALAGVGVNAYAVQHFDSASLTPTLEMTGACTVDLTNTAVGTLRSPPAVSGTVALNAPDIGQLTVTDCTDHYLLGADGGTHYAGGTAGVRDVSDGTNFVVYKLGILQTAGGNPISPVAATTDWGSSSMTFTIPSSASSVSKTGSTGVPDVYTISAVFTIPVALTAPAGTYDDVVIVGVEF